MNVRPSSGNGQGAAVVVIGGGVTGLSAAWWLARGGVDVLVIDKGIVGWEASGRNGGGAAHSFSPLFAEEQRLWPLMDEMPICRGLSSGSSAARSNGSPAAPN